MTDAAERTTAIGLFSFANSYFAAAVGLRQLKIKPTHPDSPVNYLYYHSIELYLKFYRRARGCTVRDISHRFGDKLELAAQVARWLGLEFHVEDWETITLVTPGGNQMASRFISTGFYSRPRCETLYRTCRNLHETIGPRLVEMGMTRRLPVGPVEP